MTDTLLVLELDDELGVVHDCPLCSETEFDGFGLPGADVAELWRAHDEIIAIDLHLRSLGDKRRTVLTSTDPRLDRATATGTVRSGMLTTLARQIEAAQNAATRVAEQMRWIIAGRPQRPDLDLWA